MGSRSDDAPERERPLILGVIPVIQFRVRHIGRCLRRLGLGFRPGQFGLVPGKVCLERLVRGPSLQRDRPDIREVVVEGCLLYTSPSPRD